MEGRSGVIDGGVTLGWEVDNSVGTEHVRQVQLREAVLTGHSNKKTNF